eukprot:2780075-Prymnesium_polylepis.1
MRHCSHTPRWLIHRTGSNCTCAHAAPCTRHTVWLPRPCGSPPRRARATPSRAAHPLFFLARGGLVVGARRRRLVLSLALDLEERLTHHALLYRQAPTKLTVSWQPPTANWRAAIAA